LIGKKIFFMGSVIIQGLFDADFWVFL
jgi:hypothetical protein